MSVVTTGRQKRLRGHLKEAADLLEVERPQPDQIEIEGRPEGRVAPVVARLGRDPAMLERAPQ
jgi:hypothetical protein